MAKMKGNGNSAEKPCHGGKCAENGTGKEKTGPVSQRMAERSGEFRNEHNVGLRRTRAPAALKPVPKL